MKKKKWLIGVFSLGVWGMGVCSWAESSDNVIESVSVQGVGKFAKVVIQSTRQVKYRDVMDTSKGVVLYFMEPVVCHRPAIERTFNDLVSEIRYGYKSEETASPAGKARPIEFISIRCKENVAYTVVQKEWVLAVDLRVSAATVSDAILSPTPLVKRGETSVSHHPKAHLPDSPLLKDFLTVGLANHLPLTIAEEEKAVANMRLLEAMRNLLPAVTWKYNRSNGLLLEDVRVSSDDTKFKREEYGFELGVPLFHSGRNYFNYSATVHQKRASVQAVRKVRAETVFEITRAYYNLIRAQRALAVRRTSSQRMETIVTMARKKKQLGLITEADYLGAESLYSQGYYRLLSDEKDLEIARLKMASLVDVPEQLPEMLPNPPDAVDPRALLRLNVPPENLIKTAQENRPELRAAEETALAHTYSYKAAWAEDLLKVDGTWFGGKAGGAFESDPLEMRYSWNGALQASLYFGGSTLKGARTQEHTVPDYGETTATDVYGRTVSVGLFDSLRSAGDARQARVNKDRAVYERYQARRNIEVDVREAYYNIQKSKIQIKGAQTELDYRQKELGIVQQKERMNLVEPKETLAAENAYTDSVSNYEEALAFYQTSLAGLERAVGVPLSSIPEFQ